MDVFNQYKEWPAKDILSRPFHEFAKGEPPLKPIDFLTDLLKSTSPKLFTNFGEKYHPAPPAQGAENSEITAAKPPRQHGTNRWTYIKSHVT